VKNEATIRLGVFLGVMILMVILESVAPRRVRVASRWRRSLHNLLLVITGSLLIRLVPILSAVAAAQWAEQHRWGMLNWIDVPGWMEILLAVISLDLIIYGQHVTTHRLPMLWRFHRVHHADLDLDATSGVRFHPVEMLLSMAIKVVAVTVLGARFEAIVIFEIVLNATSLFNHANVLLPGWLDRVMRWIIVTPDMHRIHHSIQKHEMNSNFGFNLPWWDHLFRTYRAQPVDPHEQLTLGLPEMRTEEQTIPLHALLAMPFQRNVKTPRDGNAAT
jgi:sterol desaturase/sphingolipid hydroxylase (fatty acid hydroxylase superfamily)